MTEEAETQAGSGYWHEVNRMLDDTKKDVKSLSQIIEKEKIEQTISFTRLIEETTTKTKENLEELDPLLDGLQEVEGNIDKLLDFLDFEETEPSLLETVKEKIKRWWK